MSIEVQASDPASGQPLALTVTYRNTSLTANETVVSDHNYLFNWMIATRSGKPVAFDPSSFKSGAGLPQTMVLAPGKSLSQTFGVRLPSGSYEARTGVNGPSPTLDVPPVRFTVR